MKQLVNKVKENINKLSRSQKIGILGGIVGILLITLTVTLLPSLSSTESSYLADQTVEGLSFENANLEVANGVSTYTVEVTNDLDKEYTLKNINIIFKDGSGQEIETLLGYIGENLEVGETKVINASIDKELTDIVKIEYVINK